MVRARFTQTNDMDLPTSFFFNLEKGRSEKKLITNLKLPQDQLTMDSKEIILHASSFFQELYTVELCDLHAKENLIKDVPHLREEDCFNLEQPLTQRELTNATREQSAGKSPGVDGLTAEFYNAFWALIWPDLHAVFLERLVGNVLSLSCISAVIILLSKKGDLACLKNCHPVSFLGTG